MRKARRDVRQSEARPLLAALKARFEAQLVKLPPKGGLAQAILYFGEITADPAAKVFEYAVLVTSLPTRC